MPCMALPVSFSGCWWLLQPPGMLPEPWGCQALVGPLLPPGLSGPSRAQVPTAACQPSALHPPEPHTTEVLFVPPLPSHYLHFSSFPPTFLIKEKTTDFPACLPVLY